MSKKRPILFSAPMVRALLDGSKTQTRRIMKQQPDFDTARAVIGHDVPDSEAVYDWFAGVALKCDGGFGYVQPNIKCPFGQPGDQLWVKETTVNVEDFGYLGPVWVESEHGRNVIEYGLAPSEDDCTEVEPEDLRLRPSIFMPRAMSRITLEITRVRVEQLHDISEVDAKSEGAPFELGTLESTILGAKAKYRSGYCRLWESINGPGSWDLNPWVWVIEFKRVPA